jgi:hemoglobin-like flavoprotein
MTPEARRLVQESWPEAADAAERLAVRFYARLFEFEPDAHHLFASTDMVVQRQKLVDMLRTIVAVLDAPEQLIPSAAALGRRHVHYGVADRQYDAVGEALRDALAETLGARFTPEVRSAWTEAYTLLASVMKRAAHRPTTGQFPVVTHA